MITDLTVNDRPRPARVTAEVLEYIAYSGQQELVHGIFRSIPRGMWGAFSNKYILSAVVAGGVRKLRKFLAVSAERAAGQEKEFVDSVARFFLETAQASGSVSRELFEALLMWGDELVELSLLDEALFFYTEILSSGVNLYPDLNIRVIVSKAKLLNKTGKFADARSLLSAVANRPYLVSDRNMVPELMLGFASELLMNNEISSYKDVLFRGLRHFYATMEHRRRFVDQIRNTYRRSYRALLDRHQSFSDRMLFAFHVLFFRVEGIWLLNRLGATRVMRNVLLGYVYWLHYSARSVPGGVQLVSDSTPPGEGGPVVGLKAHSILITRAMGGIGDLLMMTPGLHALRRRYPLARIHLAIPARYFPVFDGNPDAKLLDIENEEIDYTSYDKWFNLSDCPAARIESRSAPRVRKSRIDIFADAIGIGPLGRKRMMHRPRYFLQPGEVCFQRWFWDRHGLTGQSVIGVQLHSDETYRDYPHMELLVNRLSSVGRVVVFETEAGATSFSPSVIRVSGLPLRKAFALAAGCTLLVAPDSSFVHLAAALDTPCVGLFGPIDGRVRTRNYPKCTALDSRTTLGCLPCWRNERIPCRLTGMRGSVCMASIEVERVVSAVKTILAGDEQ